MPRTFHLLPESECFTTQSWGKLSYWVGNVVLSEADSIVVAPASDGSWPLPASRLRIVKGLLNYHAIRCSAGFLLPRSLTRVLLRRLLQETLCDLQAGDTVWIHDQPEFAVALAPFIRRTGARLFLHLHHGQAAANDEKLLRASNADCYVFNSQAIQRETLLRSPGLGRSAVLTSGLDAQVFHPDAMKAGPREEAAGVEPVTVVFSAHLARENDLGVFLKAMDLLQQRGVPVRGTVVNGPQDTPERDRRAAERRLPVPANVSFQSFNSSAELGKKLRASELFCVPTSWHESASLYMLEAMACGLPIVSAEAASASDSTAKRPETFVIPSAPERLAQTLQELVEDASARQRLAFKAHNSYAGKFMWTATKAAYRALLRTTSDGPARMAQERLRA